LCRHVDWFLYRQCFGRLDFRRMVCFSLHSRVGHIGSTQPAQKCKLAL